MTKRVRKSPEERHQEIVKAAVELISERGYNGISVQDVADRAGISKQGLLRYVGSKDNLLAVVFREYYDSACPVEDFLASGEPGSSLGDLRLPAYWRYLVRHNVKRRMMVQLFVMLQVESINPNHPLHDEFIGRYQSIWREHSKFHWHIPPELGAWEENMWPIVRKGMEVMDGIQLCWLRDESVDLYAEWLEFEPLLFPADVWQGYM